MPISSVAGLASFLRDSAGVLLRVLGAVLWAVVVAIVLGPPMLDAMEGLFGTPLTYDQSLRVYIVIALGLFLAVWFAVVLYRPTVSRWISWLVLAVTTASILFVFLLDPGNDLGSSYSWLRYLTAGILLLTGLLAVRMLWRRYVPKSSSFLQLWLVGVLLLCVALIADAMMPWAHERLTAFGVARSADEGFVFSDYWYPLWSPERLLPDVRAVLECLASALVLSGVLVVFVEMRYSQLAEARIDARPRVALLAVVMLALVTVVFFALAAVRSSRLSSPAIGVRATPVITAADGLFHTDMVFYHPAWGLLVANEGRGNVLQYYEGRIRALPDPHGLVEDTDAVTATDDAVFVSIPRRREIYHYTEDGGWSIFVNFEGRGKPEGIVVVDSVMYAVDEKYRRIYAIDMITRGVKQMVLEDARLDKPEGIAWHPGTKELLITDEDTGHIWAVTFGDTLRVFASPEDGLMNPEDIAVTDDGRVFVTDTGRREVIEFAADGTISKRIRFRRMYGDVVGIAIVPADAGEMLYVVTSDGYGSESFIPSTLWKLSLTD